MEGKTVINGTAAEGGKVGLIASLKQAYYSPFFELAIKKGELVEAAKFAIMSRSAEFQSRAVDELILNNKECDVLLDTAANVAVASGLEALQMKVVGEALRILKDFGKLHEEEVETNDRIAEEKLKRGDYSLGLGSHRRSAYRTARERALDARDAFITVVQGTKIRKVRHDACSREPKFPDIGQDAYTGWYPPAVEINDVDEEGHIMIL